MRRTGFTLGEIVTSLGIFAILAVLVVPCVSNVRARSEQTEEAQCVVNLKALTLAWLMYAEEYDQHTTPGYVAKTKKMWCHNLDIYARDSHIFECPAIKTTMTYEKSGAPIGYGMNEFLSSGVDLDAVDQPAELIALGDDSDDTAPGWYYMMDWDTRSTGDNASPPADRHNGGANMGFCDGHVQWFKYQDLGYRDGKKHPEPPGKDYWRPKNIEATP